MHHSAETSCQPKVITFINAGSQLVFKLYLVKGRSMRLLILATGSIQNSRDLGHDNRDQDMLEHATLRY